MTEAPARNPWLERRQATGDVYDRHFEQRAAEGQNVHGEADFVQSLGGRSVLDAGCGTGRVARELARRGIHVVGVDLDPDMLGTARQKAPQIEWHLADLATLDLGRTFEVIVAAGNVMIFLTPGSESIVVQRLARHLSPGGLLVAGFQVSRNELPLARYDELASAAGLTLRARFSTWDRLPWQPGSDYAVSVHELHREEA